MKQTASTAIPGSRTASFPSSGVLLLCQLGWLFIKEGPFFNVSSIVSFLTPMFMHQLINIQFIQASVTTIVS